MHDGIESDREAALDEALTAPPEIRKRNLAPWIFTGVVLAVIALVMLLVSFVPTASAAGGCGGG